MASSVIPEETLDSIFSLLRTDLTSLKTCAMVSQRFHDLVERHLYYKVTLQRVPYSDEQITPTQMLRILRASPHIASYVRSLVVSMHSNVLLDASLRTAILSITEEIAPIFPELRHLERLSIVTTSRPTVSWEDFHPSFQTAVLQALRSSTVTHLTIEELNMVPVSALAQCSSLKNFCVIRGSLLSPSNYIREVGAEQPSTCPRLESLKLIPAQTIDSCLDLSSLRSLTILIKEEEDLEHVAAISKQCASSLQRLSLNIMDHILTLYDPDDLDEESSTTDPAEGPPIPDLSTLPNLRYLAINSIIRSEEISWVSTDGQDKGSSSAYYAPFPWIIQILESLSAPLSLEHFRLDLYIDMSIEFLHQIDWNRLVQMITSERCQSLRRVEFCLQFERLIDESPDTAFQVLKRDSDSSVSLPASFIGDTGSIQILTCGRCTGSVAFSLKVITRRPSSSPASIPPKSKKSSNETPHEYRSAFIGLYKQTSPSLDPISGAFQRSMPLYPSIISFSSFTRTARSKSISCRRKSTV